MKAKKRILTAALALMMAVTLLPAGALASWFGPDKAELCYWDFESAAFYGKNGQEYVIALRGEEPDWTRSVEPDGDGLAIFEGLTAATEYDVYTRKKAENGKEPGSAVKTEFMTSLCGLSIEGDPCVGSTATVIPNPEDAEGLSYQWYYEETVTDEYGDEYTRRGAAIEGADSASYSVTEADLGKTLVVLVSKNGEELMDASWGPVEYPSPQTEGYELFIGGAEIEGSSVSGSGALLDGDFNPPAEKCYVYIVVNYERADGTTWAVAGTYPVDEDGMFDFPSITGVSDTLTGILAVGLDAKVGSAWAGHRITPVEKLDPRA